MEALENEFEILVKKNKSIIYTVCYMFSKDYDDVSELFQEVLINLWKGYPKYKDTGNVRSWIYKVSLNTCISEKRKTKKNVVPLTIDAPLFENDESDRRQVEMLHKRISRLQPFDRAIILLWLENISYEEIGAIVGISTKNVSVRLVRIKEQLINMSND
jgi:RNA polymerase sigma factor (sigma-70 family)